MMRQPPAAATTPPGARYAFYLDATACSGCKACQVACKDKHDLPLGVVWRRVYEVSGGGWERSGEAWRHDAFAFNLSLACQHCDRPICVEVCPTRALHRAAGGLVQLDRGRCVGCRYCEWACPYDAPQYDARSGTMSKCTLCADELALGNAPACVAACGLRALDFGAPEALAARHALPNGSTPGTGTPPLPDPALTRPALLLTPHAAAPRAAAAGARVANLEEVRPGRTGRSNEASLVAFTVAVQLAVGLFWAWSAARWLGTAPGIARPALALAVALAVAGTLASLLHLGRPARAWRALANLRSSWLSREILLTLAFLAASAAVLALDLQAAAGAAAPARMMTAAAAIGLALVYAMARVYRLRTVPAWNTVRTLYAFLLTALVPGALAAAALFAPGSLARAVLLALFAATLTTAVLARARFYAVPARGVLASGDSGAQPPSSSKPAARNASR